MSIVVIYEELFLDQLTFVPEEQCFTYPCPCGDTFTFFVVGLFIVLNCVGGTAARGVHRHLSQLFSERETGAEGSMGWLGHLTSRVNWTLSSQSRSPCSLIFPPPFVFLRFVYHCVSPCMTLCFEIQVESVGSQVRNLTVNSSPSLKNGCRECKLCEAEVYGMCRVGRFWISDPV